MRLIIAITLLGMFLVGCIPRYYAGRDLVRVIPIEHSDSTSIVQNIGATFDRVPGSHVNEVGYGGQVFYQIGKTYEYGSIHFLNTAYYGTHSIDITNGDSTSYYMSMDGKCLKYYGISPELRIALFVPFYKNRLGLYGTFGGYIEDGSYSDFREKGNELNEIEMVHGNQGITVGAGVLYERMMNKDVMTTLQIGVFNPLWLTAIAKVKYQKNNIWFSIFPTVSGIKKGVMGIGYSREF